MVAGIVVGAICHNQLDPETAKQVASYFSIVTDVFIRLIRMIIGPLVFSTLVVGIAHMGDASTLGRIGARTFIWFIGASLVSLFLGLVMVNLLAPGENLGLALPEAIATAAPQASSLNLREFITHLVPRSFFEAMANNEILQIVVFSAFVGIACMNQGQ
jgi:Na+/H+-dicarboxylate symporter